MGNGLRILRRSLVLAAVAAVAAAGWHTWRGLRLEARAERALARADVAPAAAEPLELAAARDELEALTTALLELPDRDSLESMSFGATYQLDVEHAAALESGVAERAWFYEGLERLPAALWEADGAPAVRSPRLGRLRTAVNALAARAWLRARAGDGPAAGRDLARALALARVTDSGDTIGLLVRTALECCVVEDAGRMVEQFSLDQAFLAPLEVEAERSLSQDRVARLLDADLGYMVTWQAEVVSELPWWRVWWERPRVLEGRLELLELHAACLRAVRADPHAPLPEADACFPFHGEDHKGWVHWTSVTETDGVRRARLAELLVAG